MKTYSENNVRMSDSIRWWTENLPLSFRLRRKTDTGKMKPFDRTLKTRKWNIVSNDLGGVVVVVQAPTKTPIKKQQKIIYTRFSFGI